MQTEPLIEGWTAPLRFQLTIDDAPFNASGMSVELILRGKDGVEVAEVGATTFSTPATSIVTYTPNANDLQAAKSPMRARFKVTSGSEVAFYPRGEADEWIVRRP
jgi:hypothetical protein